MGHLTNTKSYQSCTHVFQQIFSDQRGPLGRAREMERARHIHHTNHKNVKTAQSNSQTSRPTRDRVVTSHNSRCPESRLPSASLHLVAILNTTRYPYSPYPTKPQLLVPQTIMARSVSFAPQLVSECHHIPRVSEDKIPDYYYSKQDIERFQRIWKSIILQKMKQLDQRRDSRNGKRTKPDARHANEEQVTSAKRRRVCSGAAKQNSVTVVRTVSPADAQGASR